MNISKPSLPKRKIRLLKDRDLRNKYVADQLKIGLRNQLRSLRDERGLTQGELAKLIGTKQSVISRIERSPERVGMPVFLDIAKQLDVAFVARFEAIDTFIDWYDNLTQKRMTPRKSEEVLNECEKQNKEAKNKIAAPDILSEEFLEESQTGQVNVFTESTAEPELEAAMKTFTKALIEIMTKDAPRKTKKSVSEWPALNPDEGTYSPILDYSETYQLLH